MDLKLGDSGMIIDACAQEHLLRNECAYVLATAFHETAHTMKPIEEMGSQTYLRSKSYYPFFGRGYVQLTWEAGYKKASEKLGVDFVANPNLLLQPEYAAKILVIGMKEGWFTGKKLSDYIDLQHSDFVGARRIINSIDRANLIALYATQYEALLKAVGYGETPVAAPAPVATPQPAAPAPVQAPQPTPAPNPPVSAPVAAKPHVGIDIGTVGLVSALAIYWREILGWFHHFIF